MVRNQNIIERPTKNFQAKNLIFFDTMLISTDVSDYPLSLLRNIPSWNLFFERQINFFNYICILYFPIPSFTLTSTESQSIIVSEVLKEIPTFPRVTICFNTTLNHVDFLIGSPCENNHLIRLSFHNTSN